MITHFYGRKYVLKLIPEQQSVLGYKKEDFNTLYLKFSLRNL